MYLSHTYKVYYDQTQHSKSKHTGNSVGQIRIMLITENYYSKSINKTTLDENPETSPP
jgi:hypothetical protein